MNKKQTLTGALCAGLFTLGLTTTADATLLGRLAATPGGTDYQAYYDTVQDITWLADANYAKTSGYDADGRMTWDESMAWVSTLNRSNHLGYNDWRLPGVTDVGNDGATYTYLYQGVDYGYNIDTANGEMASLWYDTLGNKAYYNTVGFSQSGWGLRNSGPFSNLLAYKYWSGVEYAPGSNLAWGFDTYYGFQHYPSKDSRLYGWAVRSGDVSAVPVPAAIWLFGSGLIGLLGVAKRKR